MQKIKIIRFGMSEDIKIAIRDMIDQLEKDRIAIAKDIRAFRFFSRFTPIEYKDNDALIFTKKISQRNKGNLIVLGPNYKIEKLENYEFRIIPKENGNTSVFTFDKKLGKD